MKRIVNEPSPKSSRVHMSFFKLPYWNCCRLRSRHLGCDIAQSSLMVVSNGYLRLPVVSLSCLLCFLQVTSKMVEATKTLQFYCDYFCKFHSTRIILRHIFAPDFLESVLCFQAAFWLELPFGLSLYDVLV